MTLPVNCGAAKACQERSAQSYKLADAARDAWQQAVAGNAGAFYPVFGVLRDRAIYHQVIAAFEHESARWLLDSGLFCVTAVLCVETCTEEEARKFAEGVLTEGFSAHGGEDWTITSVVRSC